MKQFVKARSTAFVAVLCFYALVLVPAVGQQSAATTQAPNMESSDTLNLQQKAENALDRVKRNDIGTGIVDATYYIELSAHADPKRVIPVLEAYFARSNEQDLQNEIASVLVSLGDTDPRFWNLILEQAREALASDTPDPFVGMEDPADPSPPCSDSSFIAWSKTHNLSVKEACKQALSAIPKKLRPLADTGDPRAIPVLQEAMRADNFMMQMIAVNGLVLTQDHDSVSLIIDAIHRAPQPKADSFADSLIESDDPRAEAVVKQYLPDVNFAEAKRFRAENSQWRRPLLTRR